MDLVEYDYDHSLVNAIADLRGIGWRCIQEQVTELEPTNIPEEVHKLEILNPVTFLHSLTLDPSLWDRIPLQRRNS